MSERSDYKKEALSLLMVLFCAVGIYCIGLGSYGIVDPGEAYYAEAAREMCESNDFITPHLNYQIYFSKPILTFWIIASSYRIWGVNEFACRIPFALLAVLLVLSVYGIARKIFNRRSAVFAAFVTATAPLMVAMVKLSPIDLAFTVFLNLSLFSCALAALIGQRGFYPLIYVFLALAALTKGPVAAVLLLLGCLLFALAERAKWSIWKERLKRLKIIPGLCIFLVLTLPWYVAISVITKGLFPKVFFLYENLARFAGHTNLAHTSHFRYLPTLIYGFFPWALFLVPAARFVWQEHCDHSSSEFSEEMEARVAPNKVALLLLSFSITTFLFFSFSRTQLDTYLLPIIAPLSLVIGHYLDVIVRQWSISQSTTPVWAKILIGLITFSGLLFAAFAVALGFSPEINVDQPVAESIAILAILLALGYLSYLILSIRKFYAASIYSLLATNALAAIVAVQTAFHIMDVREMRDLRLLCKYGRKLEDSIAVFKAFKPSMIFYTGRPIDSFFHTSQLLPLSTHSATGVAEYRQLIIVNEKSAGQITQLPNVGLKLMEKRGNWAIYQTNARLTPVEKLESIFNNQDTFEKSLKGEGNWGPLTVPYAGGDPHWWQHANKN